jgi:hypothetical protein
MYMVDAPVIRQRLFASRMGDGTIYFLAFLASGGCAVLRDDEVIESWDNDVQGLDFALDRFLEVTHAAQRSLDGLSGRA